MSIDLAFVSHVMFVVVASVAFAIALISCSRLRSKKAVTVTVGFGLFFVNGLTSIPEIFNQAYNVGSAENIHLFIDAVAILFLILGTLMG